MQAHAAASWAGWAWTAGVLAIAIVAGLVVQWILYHAVARVAARTGSAVDAALIRRTRRPARWILPFLAVFLVLPGLRLPATALATIQHAFALALIAVLAWSIIALTEIAGDVVVARYQVDVADNLQARRIRTQLHLVSRMVVVGVVIVALSIMLMTFPGVRHLGVSLFASAGIVGLVAGIAARPAISNLIAGLQVAIVQPIRLDDVVVVEGEWGRIEEIGLTYVVVRIWDLRRLVVPLSYFIQNPFQNWTRQTADLLGSVFVYADYTVPVEAVRQELQRILEHSGMWDGKVSVLQVTNATEHAIELRALMSAPDSSQAWNLRCHVREKLIEFLQHEHPGGLPKTRAEIRGAGAADVPERSRSS